MSSIKAVSKLINVLGSVIAAIALVMLIAMFILPRLLGWQLVVVLSGSMQPTLPVGAIAMVEPRDPASVRVGDVLTFRLASSASNNGKTVQVTHRVIEIIGQSGNLSFKTQGDANNTPDSSPVPARDVVGIVRWNVPYLGYAADWLRSPLGILLLMIVPGSYVVLGELRKIWREIQVLRTKKKLAKEVGR